MIRGRCMPTGNMCSDARSCALGLCFCNCVHLCPRTAYFPCPFSSLYRTGHGRRRRATAMRARVARRFVRDRFRVCRSHLSLPRACRCARESRAGSSVTVFVSVARTSLLEHVLRIVLDGPMIFCSVFSLGHSGVGALPSSLALIWQPTPRLEKNAHLAEAWS